jgi:chaperone required for assembly of F1-ATPase
MRDLFEDMFSNQPLDPTEAARRAMRPQLRRRFYERAQVEDAGDDGAGEFRILLDGRPIRTPARRTLAAPTRALAEAIAAEWEAQREVIDPARMPLTRLANSIIDGVADAAAAVAAEVEKYLASDLLFYRAESPDGLVAREAAAWDPVLAWAREALGARFVTAQGMVHVAQPAQSLAAASAALASEASGQRGHSLKVRAPDTRPEPGSSARAAIPRDLWRLGAVHAITTLTGSALIAIALARGALTIEQAWATAHVDEDWNMAFWGRDEVALERRAARFAEMQAAALVLQAV